MLILFVVLMLVVYGLCAYVTYRSLRDTDDSGVVIGISGMIAAALFLGSVLERLLP